MLPLKMPEIRILKVRKHTHLPFQCNVKVNILLELTKVRISLFATLSTSAGFILAHRGLSEEMIFPILGVFFLASGSCALNQYQEDGMINGWIGRGASYSFKETVSIHCLEDLHRPPSLGSVILYSGAHRSALGLGLFAVFWYNGVYTPLKRKSAFASVPGATGRSDPPVIGWISEKGFSLLTPKSLAFRFSFLYGKCLISGSSF